MLLCGHVQTLPLRCHKWLAFSLIRLCTIGISPRTFCATSRERVHGGLTFSPGAHGDASVVRGYVDASWGEDPSTRKSQSGYVFTLGNAAISWKSKLQTTVALSSTEAEYLALSAAVKEPCFYAIWSAIYCHLLPRRLSCMRTISRRSSRHST